MLENRKLDPLHRRSAEIVAVLFVVPLKQLSQINGACWKPRSKCRLGRVGSAFVPGTHILADITSVQPIRKLTADRLIEWGAVFDVQVRDATPGIELIGCGDRVRVARVDAPCA